MTFKTLAGVSIPALDAAQMLEIDRIAMEDFGLGVLQMMENAGRSLATLAQQARPTDGPIAIFAGPGGNGGGGLCAARHLHNRGLPIHIFLSKPANELTGPAAHQLNILQQAGVNPTHPDQVTEALSQASLVLDALLGYSLRGAPRGQIKNYISAIKSSNKPVISLDIPSGIDASTGDAPGECVRAQATLTLALPKLGLTHPAVGQLFLADIGIPPAVYTGIGIEVEPFFDENYLLELDIAHD